MTLALEALNAGASAVTAALGLYVTYLAYRGYRRRDSPTMRALAVGVGFVAVVPYLLTFAVAPLLALSDAQTILAVTLAHAVGLAAIHRSFGSD